MKIFNDNNLEGKIEPIWVWMGIVVICLFTVIIIGNHRVEIFRYIINEIFDKGMIDEFQKLLLIKRWC